MSIAHNFLLVVGCKNPRVGDAYSSSIPFPYIPPPPPPHHAKHLGCATPLSLIDYFCVSVFHDSIRVGFVSGPKALIYRIQLHMEASVLHSSAVSQVGFQHRYSNYYQMDTLCNICVSFKSFDCKNIFTASS